MNEGRHFLILDILCLWIRYLIYIDKHYAQRGLHLFQENPHTWCVLPGSGISAPPLGSFSYLLRYLCRTINQKYEQGGGRVTRRYRCYLAGVGITLLTEDQVLYPYNSNTWAVKWDRRHKLDQFDFRYTLTSVDWLLSNAYSGLQCLDSLLHAPGHRFIPG